MQNIQETRSGSKALCSETVSIYIYRLDHPQVSFYTNLQKFPNIHTNVCQQLLHTYVCTNCTDLGP